MFICTQEQNEHFGVFSVFDTKTGICYILVIKKKKENEDPYTFRLKITSVHCESSRPMETLDQSAIDFWEQLPYHSDGIKKMKFFNASFKAIERAGTNDH